MATAAAAIYGACSAGNSVSEGDKIPNTTGATPAAGAPTTYTASTAATANTQALVTSMGGNTQLLMMCCGGAALAATAWAYMAPKNIYPASDFQNGWPPDYDHSYQPATSSVMPSEGILDRYLV